MAASTHSQDRQAGRRGPSASWADDPAEILVSDGLRLLLGAPELALVFGERAAALAEASGSERVWAYAEGLSVSARVRLGHRADVVNRAVVVLRTAEVDGHGDLAAQMRTELALCARSVGVPLTGLAALRPVLADEHAQPVCRVGALLQFVGCMASIGRRGVLDRALEEADRLAESDPSIGDVDRVSLRTLVQVRTAAHLRRHGDISASIDTARKGLELLDAGSGVLIDSTQMRARLTLELVCALLDQGAGEEAAALAQPLFAGEARAAAIAPLAWLRLAIATRVHLASATPETAGMLIRDALHHTRRHELLALSSRLLLELSHIEEQLGRPAEALTCLREARVCEHSYGRLRRQALGLLTGEFGRGEQPAADFNRALGDYEERSAQQRESPPSGKRRRVEPSTEATQMMPAITADAPPPRSAPAEPSVPPLDAEPPAAHAVDSAWDTVVQPAVAWTAAKHSAPEDVTESPDAGSRHQTEDGPSARSVLERLGVSVGTGGRRRAADDEPEQHPQHEQLDQAWAEQPEPSWQAEPAQPAHAEWSWRPEPLPEPQPEPEPEPQQAARPDVAVDTADVEDEPEAEPAPVRELDSVLAVFSSWANGDDDNSTVAPRVRSRRWQRSGESAGHHAANGHAVNGDSPLHGGGGLA